MTESVPYETSGLLPPVYAVKIVKTGNPESQLSALPNPLGAIPAQGTKVATLAVNQKITSEGHFQDTRFISLKFQSEQAYKPGDILMI